MFLEFDAPETAVRVADALAGRSFNGRILVATFLGERAYAAGHFWGWGFFYGSGAEGVGEEAQRVASEAVKRSADGEDEEEVADDGDGSPSAAAQSAKRPKPAAVTDDASTDDEGEDDGVATVEVNGIALDDVE